jgi:hypothetical protein
VRERARAVRDAGARLSQAFRASQAGTVRPALAIEDGTVAVTDNGLKVRIEPRQPRNAIVQVLIGAEGTGLVASSPDQPFISSAIR